MFIYVLLITVMYVSPDDHLQSAQVAVVDKFSNLEDCLVEQKDLQAKLEESYPGDNDYKLSCEKVVKK